MKRTAIKFGTDGWRGIIAEDFTFDNVRACAQGTADYYKAKGLAEKGLVIGYDTRFASEDFAEAVAEVFAGNGIKVYLCSEAAPTPVISFGVVKQKAGGAIIITASHNPAKWNGFKIKTESGASAPSEITTEIEANASKVLTDGKIKKIPFTQAMKQGPVEHIELASVYFDHISRLIHLDELRKAELKVVFDPMYGSGAGYFTRLLGESNIELMEINGGRNTFFGGVQPEPIAANLTKLTEAVKQHGASVGLATDGDADRMGIVDENGLFLTQLQVFSLLCLYLLEIRGERGSIIKTLTTSQMIHRLGEIFDVPVFETSVGFKYIAPRLIKENAIIGGEESGGYGFKGHVPERDGILACLYFLDLMIKTNKTPSQLIKYLYKKVGPHYYKRIDVEYPQEQRQAMIERVENSRKEDINGVKVARIDTEDGYRFFLEDNAWLLIRFSGTEPILRIYAESNSQTRTEGMLDTGKAMTGV